MNIKFSLVAQLLFVVLILVFLGTLIDYCNSLNTGVESSYSIQTIIVTGVLAFATLLLLIITGDYAKSTKEMLDEQIKLRKIAAIEKKLENVYNPTETALNEFLMKFPVRLKNEDNIPDNFLETFSELNDKLMDIRKNYLHLISQTMSNKNREVFKSWLLFSNEKNIDNFNNLINIVGIFHSSMFIEIKKETAKLNELNFDLHDNDSGIEIAESL